MQWKGERDIDHIGNSLDVVSSLLHVTLWKISTFPRVVSLVMGDSTCHPSIRHQFSISKNSKAGRTSQDRKSVMKYSYEEKQGVIVIYMQDDSPWSKEDGFREMVHSLVKEGSCCVVVELSGLNHADIAMLSCLVWGKKRALQIGGDLALAAVPFLMRTLLKATSLDRLFTSFDSEEEAIQYLQVQGLCAV